MQTPKKGKNKSMKFTEFGLNPNLIKALNQYSFTETTQVQEKTIPVVLKGQDAVVRSQTGSGKTLAYCLPMIQKNNYDYPFIQSLVICPTRELALQVAAEIKKVIKYLPNMKVVAIYGGSDITRQIKDLKLKPQIIVGTPGRIMDHLNRRTLKLQNLKCLVLDEADEMLNMGFKEDIESILKYVPGTRQTLMFSATYPQSIKDIVNNYLTNPVSIEVGSENKSLANINQFYIHVNKLHKKESLLQLFEKLAPKHAIVFTNTKRMAEDIADLLNKANFSALALHGDLRQSQRKKVLAEIKNSASNTLVASDVAARGIDINDIDFVINYDIPHNTEYFLHRIGRTARAGKSGSAVTIVTTKEQLNNLREIEKQTNSKINELTLSASITINTVKNKSAHSTQKTDSKGKESKSRSFKQNDNYKKPFASERNVKDGFERNGKSNFERKNNNSSDRKNNYNKSIRNSNSSFNTETSRTSSRNEKRYKDNKLNAFKENKFSYASDKYADKNNFRSKNAREDNKTKNYGKNKSFETPFSKPYDKRKSDNEQRSSTNSRSFNKPFKKEKEESFKPNRENGGKNYFSKFTSKKPNSRKSKRY